MARFDVYRNPNAKQAPGFPFLLEVQTTLLGNMPTTVVIPLGLPAVIDHVPVVRLNPPVKVSGRKLLVMTQELAAIKRRALKEPVTNLSAERDEIVAALDFLFTGF